MEKRRLSYSLLTGQFKHHVDEAIIRLRYLGRFVEKPVFIEHLPLDWGGSCRRDGWLRFVYAYLAHQAWVERDPSSRLGRIRRAAEYLCEDAGDAGKDVMIDCLQSLCHLATSNISSTVGKRLLFKKQPVAHTANYPSERQLKTDLLVAAIHLNRISLVDRLLLEPGYWVDATGLCSDVFGDAFTAATKRGNLDMMRLLQAHGPTSNLDPNSALSLQAARILRAAALYGHRDAFNFALDTEEFKNLTDSNFDLLREASLYTPITENYERVTALLGPDSRAFTRGGELVARLTRSAAAGDIDMVRYFLDHGVCPNHDAARRDATTKGVLARAQSRVNRPLLRAIANGNHEVVRLLLERGADPNWYSPMDTPLMAAARKRAPAIAKMLLEAGADVNEGCPPPIVLAVWKEDDDMYHLLRERGAIVDSQNGGWAMALARRHGFESMMDLLVQEGVDKDMILSRVPEQQEVYHKKYLVPECAADPWESIIAEV